MSRNHKVRQQQTQNWVYIDIIQKAKHKAERYKKKKSKVFRETQGPGLRTVLIKFFEFRILMNTFEFNFLFLYYSKREFDCL